MDFMKILKSLEELLYEVMTWLVFYPRTLWLTVRRPLQMMEYADAELGDRVREQYTDTLSPPLFLLITIVISHVLELAIVGQSELVTQKTGLRSLITDDTNLILFRAVAISLFPLAMSVQLLKRRGQTLDRETMRAPFYSQCYITAPFALLFGIVGLAPLDKPAWLLSAMAATVAAAVIYVVLQTIWTTRHASGGTLRAGLSVCLAYGAALAILLGAGVLVAR